MLDLTVQYFQDSPPEGLPYREEHFIRRHVQMPLPVEQTALVLAEFTGAALGAEISGIDLSQPLDEETRQALYDAIVDNIAVVFKDQQPIFLCQSDEVVPTI